MVTRVFFPAQTPLMAIDYHNSSPGMARHPRPPATQEGARSPRPLLPRRAAPPRGTRGAGGTRGHPPQQRSRPPKCPHASFFIIIIFYLYLFFLWGGVMGVDLFFLHAHAWKGFVAIHAGSCSARTPKSATGPAAAGRNKSGKVPRRSVRAPVGAQFA